MNTHDHTDLDSFDRALLTELRRVAAEGAPAAARRTSRRWAYAGSGVAAAAVAAFGLSTLGSTAAYAVDEEGDGDIVITIRELDDADGLERALAEHGIEAEVDYDSEGIGGVRIESAPDRPEGTGEVGGDVVERRTEAHVRGEEVDEKYARTAPGGAPADHPCGAPGDLPFETELGDDYVITIPADSVIRESDAVLSITTSGVIDDNVAGIQVSYSIGGVDCTFGSATVGTERD